MPVTILEPGLAALGATEVARASVDGAWAEPGLVQARARGEAVEHPRVRAVDALDLEVSGVVHGPWVGAAPLLG